MTYVKTCGITSERDASLCVEAGADGLGLVVEYPQPVPWTLTRERALELRLLARPGVETVAVVGGDAATILAIVEHVQPHAVQLHMDESERTVREVRRSLDGSGIVIVKAVRITVDQGAVAPAAHWLDVARRFVDAGAHRILLDSRTEDRPAGTGVAFDWSIAREVAAGLDAPMLLAGGLAPENVGSAVAEVRPFGVDVISSIEDAEHRKVQERVSLFIAAVRGAVPSGHGSHG